MTAAARYPVMVDLAGRACLVVGAGAVAGRKVQGLLDVGADLTVIAPSTGSAVASAAAAGRIVHHARRWRPTDLTEAPRWAFVVAATDDPTVNDAVVAAAEASGIWVNDAGSPSGGPAALPAVARRGPVTVAVSTGGVHPGAARWLRDLAADAIGPEHLAALDLVAELRASSAADRRPNWRTAVESGMLDLIREGREAEAKERLQACLSSSSD